MDNKITTHKIEVPVMSSLYQQGITPEYLFWVGCAGSYHDRYKKVSREMIKILDHIKISYAILGNEERCTGDAAKRAGNEFLFQMMALRNIEILNKYKVKKIITICPHCFNILKNEYPDLGGNYEVYHYTQLFSKWIDEKKLIIDSEILQGKNITFHDPCYLGRGNGEFLAPRKILNELKVKQTEMKRCKANSLCCGAGGAQMFKEAEKGFKEIYMERTEEALATNASVIATSCPFCMNMLTDGIKYKDKQQDVSNLDIIELVSMALQL